MRAVASRNGQLRVTDVDKPEPVEGEALVKVLACGICGSDLHFVRFGTDIVKGSMSSGNGRFAPDLSRDIIMGHEFCVEVVGYGPNTTGPVGIGDRVTSVPTRGAYSNDYPGGYSEYMVLDASMLLPVADSVGDRTRGDDRTDGGRHARGANGPTERRRADGGLRLRTGRTGDDRESAQRGRGG